MSSLLRKLGQAALLGGAGALGKWIGKKIGE